MDCYSEKSFINLINTLYFKVIRKMSYKRVGSFVYAREMHKINFTFFAVIKADN